MMYMYHSHNINQWNNLLIVTAGPVLYVNSSYTNLILSKIVWLK